MTTLQGQIEAVEREIRMRKKLYPRWVQLGRLTADNAAREVAAMEAVLVTLKSCLAPAML